jgi:lysophospholipase L1-like esterase
MAGTNNIHDAWKPGFGVSEFMNQLKKFMIELVKTFEGSKIVLIGLFPRAYCKHCTFKNVMPGCRNLHQDIKLWDMNRVINSINYRIKEVCEYDYRFREKVEFLNLFRAVQSSGTRDNAYGGVLSKDGLHLSFKGNQLIDRFIFKALKELP